MRRGRRWLLVVSVAVLVLALAVCFVPDARGWVGLQVRSLRVRVALTPALGARLGSVEADEWHIEDVPAHGLTLELSDGLMQADLCRAMLALEEASPSSPALLSIETVRPDASMAFERLTWDRASGRLERWVGDGPYSESVNTFVPRGVIPSGVDRATLQRFADGQSIEWQ